MKIIATLLMIGSVYCFSQKKTEVILEEKLGLLDCKYQNVIDQEKLDTLTYVSIRFRNSEYTHIIEYSSISLNAKSGSMDVYEMMKDLKSIQDDAANKREVTYDRRNYYLFLSSNYKTLFINTPKESRQVSGYTTIPVKAIPVLYDWLNQVWMKVQKFEG